MAVLLNVVTIGSRGDAKAVEKLANTLNGA
jgi:hypothetical protein